MVLKNKAWREKQAFLVDKTIEPGRKKKSEDTHLIREVGGRANADMLIRNTLQKVSVKNGQQERESKTVIVCSATLQPSRGCSVCFTGLTNTKTRHREKYMIYFKV